MNLSSTASSVIMIKPLSFCANPDTLASNSFQSPLAGVTKEEILDSAQAEFLNFQSALQTKGIKIISYDELLTRNTPDALYPNNWFCHLPDGRVFVFPMFPENRRREYRDDVIRDLDAKQLVDLRYLEKENIFLEGTGSLILDHANKVGFACLSPRTSARAVEIFSQLSGYRITTFNSVDEAGQPIYHTNVMMALSPKFAVIAMCSIKNTAQKQLISTLLTNTGRSLVEISYNEMNQFAGNMLFLKNNDQRPFWIASSKAYYALKPELRLLLESEATFIHADLNTIERYGGGGARCLLAEVFTSAYC